MRERTSTPTVVDEAWLVWVAARATGVAPETLLTGCDVAAVARVVAEVEAARADGEDGVRSRRADGRHVDGRHVEQHPVVRAATVLVAVVRHRPFAAGNRAVAWLAAALTLVEHGTPIWLAEDDAVELVVGAEEGRVSVDEVAVALAAPGEALPWRCPACGNRLHRYERRDVRRAVPLVGGSRHELVARCAFEHGGHDRSGRTAPKTAAGTVESWRPIVRQPSGRDAMLVLVDAGAVLLRGVAGAYEATQHRDLAAGALVGDWDVLGAQGEPLGRVDHGDLVVDATGGAVDWCRLASALRGVPVA